ncbi:hypothetical protein GCM10027519_41890 [Kineococcus endophyticus]
MEREGLSVVLVLLMGTPVSRDAVRSGRRVTGYTDPAGPGVQLRACREAGNHLDGRRELPRPAGERRANPGWRRPPLNYDGASLQTLRRRRCDAVRGGPEHPRGGPTLDACRLSDLSDCAS